MQSAHRVVEFGVPAQHRDPDLRGGDQLDVHAGVAKCFGEVGGDARVDAWVSLGGPNHGTDFALSCLTTSCTEMRQGSTFLAALNSVDETPGAVRYGTWWSPCDGIINPDSSVALSGATNTKTACLTHSALHDDATVYGQVRDFIHR